MGEAPARALLRLLVVLVLVQGCGPGEEGPPGNDAAPALAPDEGFEVGMGIDRAAYDPGDPMTVVLRVTNATNHMRSLEFRTSQRYDFILLDENDAEVYRWSTGQAFLQVLGEEVLEAGQQRAWEDVLSAPTEPGQYWLQGVIPAAEGRLSTTLPFEVR